MASMLRWELGRPRIRDSSVAKGTSILTGRVFQQPASDDRGPTAAGRTGLCEDPLLHFQFASGCAVLLQAVRSHWALRTPSTG